MTLCGFFNCFVEVGMESYDCTHCDQRSYCSIDCRQQDHIHSRFCPVQDDGNGEHEAFRLLYSYRFQHEQLINQFAISSFVHHSAHDKDTFVNNTRLTHHALITLYHTLPDTHQPRWNTITFHNASFVQIPPDFTERIKTALFKQPSPFTFAITYRIVKPVASPLHGLAIETFVCPYTFQWPAATLPLPLTIDQLKSSIHAHELQLLLHHSIDLAFQNLSLTTEESEMAHSSPSDPVFMDDDDDFDSIYL